jgi:hypothetical protein
VAVELIAVDRAEPADHPVRRGVGDEVVDVAAAALSGDHERSVLDERVRVDEVGDVLPRRAPADRPALGDGARTGVVEPDAMALVDLGEVRASGGRVVGRLARRGVDRCRSFDRSQVRQHVARHHRDPDVDEELVEPPRLGRGHLVVHLHRLDEEHDLTRLHDRTLGDLDRDDRALQGTADRGHLVTTRAPDGSTPPFA